MPMLARLSSVVLALAFLVAPPAAASASAATITLLWDANTEPDVTGYVVSYGTQSGVHGTRLDVGKTTSTVLSLGPGTYFFVVQAYSIGGTSAPSAEVSTTILPNGVSNGLLAIDTPAPLATMTSAFEVAGWGIDQGAASGSGVDAVQFYIFPSDGAGGAVYVGQGSYGWPRADVGALFGSQFTNSGYHFTITGLGPGAYMLGAYAHSTVSGTFSILATQHFNVSATTLMSIDAPRPEGLITSQTFAVAGWAIDRTGPSGTGVDAVHVYAYPNPGSGQPPIFLGVATLGIARSDVSAAYGTRYNASGYVLNLDRTAAGLAPGVYDIVAHTHSAVTGTFVTSAVVRVTLQ